MTKTLREAKVVDVEKRRYPSKHYVYVIEVSWSEGTQTVVYRRYSAFFEFQCGLLQRFPVEAGTNNPVDRCIPFLPGKILFGRSHVRSVAEKRLGQLNDYCKTLIRLPSSISDDSFVKNFFEVTPEDIDPPVKKEKKKSSDTANEISDPVLLEQYTAIADYKKQKNTECDLTAGQIVEVIDKNENGWWFVHLDDLNEGWVPATYLESVYGQTSSASPTFLHPGEEEVFITTSSYAAKNSDELSFERGILVEVFQKGLDGWWKGRYQSKEGFVPACYLSRYYGGMNTADGGIQVVSTMQAAVESSRKESMSVNNKSRSPLKAKVNIGGIRMKTGFDPYADEPIYAPTPRKEEVQAKKKQFPVPAILKKKPILSSSNSYDSFDSDSSGDSNYAKPDVMFGKKSPGSKYDDDDDDGDHDYETLSEHYMTIADFNSQANDGLSFQEGTNVSVITKNPSGWWFVEAGTKEGWVPSSYLEKSFKPHSNDTSKAKSKPSPPTRNDIHVHKSSSRLEEASNKPKPKPPAPVRRDTHSNKSPVSISLSNKSKPPPPVRRDIVLHSSVSVGDDHTDLGHSVSPPVPTKPKPFKKPVAAKQKSDGGSVAAMAAVLSQGLNKQNERRSSIENEDRRPSVSKKPIVPRRDTTAGTPSDLAFKSNSLKRSSSSDSVREVERPPDTRLSKSPYPGRPLNKQMSDSKPMKFLRKSTENLLAAQADEETKLSSSPVPTPRKSFSTTRVTSPKPLPAKTPSPSTVKPVLSGHNGQMKKPTPPTRNNVPPSNSQTLKLAGLEKALKKGKSPPLVTNRQPYIPNKKPSPPQRPNNSPHVSTIKAKKTPPPRPGNSPAANRKVTYVTIADYGGYDDSSLSFSEGENVKVLEKKQDGWWYVEIGNREGWVPSTFIEKSEKPDRPLPPIRKPTVSRPKPLPPVRKENTCRAVADYSIPVYEDSGINLIENEIYEILERSDSGWWFVKKDREEGWAPSSFLESL